MLTVHVDDVAKMAIQPYMAAKKGKTFKCSFAKFATKYGFGFENGNPLELLLMVIIGKCVIQSQTVEFFFW